MSTHKYLDLEGLQYFYTKLKQYIADYYDGNIQAQVNAKLDEMLEDGTLQTLADTYFADIDVQEEINNKLDEMAEDGTLAEIIANFVDSSVTVYAPKLLKSGNLTVIQFKEDNAIKTAIIDFGHSGSDYYNDLTTKLISKGYTSFDYAFVTHYHQDHVGSLTALINDARFDFSNCQFYLPTTPDYSQFTGDTTDIIAYETSIKAELDSKNISYQSPTDNTILNINNSSFIKFYNCDLTDFTDYYNIIVDEKTNLNNFSMIIEINHQNSRMLMMADGEAGCQKTLIDNDIQVPDMMLVPHHAQGGFRVGDDNISGGIYRPFIRSIYKPKVALIEGLITTSYLFNALSRDIDTYRTNDNDVTITHSYGNYLVNGDIYSPTDVKDGEYFIAKFMQGNYNLGTENVPSRIADNTDLDTIVNGGTYYSVNSTVTATIAHKPSDVSDSFKLISNQLDSERTLQILIERNSPFIYTRYGRHTDALNSWKGWKVYCADDLGKKLPTGANLNDYGTQGVYYCDSGSTASGIYNIPTEISTSFKLIVDKCISDTRVRQTIIVNRSIPNIYTRANTSDGWGDWYKADITSVESRQPA